MNDWRHVEIHYANSSESHVFENMCANALPWEFCFCVLPSALFHSQGQSSVFLAPIAFFNQFGHLPYCPIFIDDILPNLHPSVHLDNEFWADTPVNETRATLKRLGYIESMELEDFMIGVYRQLGEFANPWADK